MTTLTSNSPVPANKLLIMSIVPSSPRLSAKLSGRKLKEKRRDSGKSSALQVGGGKIQMVPSVLWTVLSGLQDSFPHCACP